MTRTARRAAGFGPSHKSVSALLVTAALLLSACGSTQAADTPSVASLDNGETETTEGKNDGDNEEPSEADLEKAQLKYDQCMLDNGVDQDELFGDLEEDEDSGISSGQVEFTEEDFEEFEAAQEECQPILDDAFGEFTLSPEDEAKQADVELKFNQCMADKGFDFEESEDGEVIELPEDVDIDKLDEASKECNEIFEDAFGSVDAIDDEDAE